MPQKKIDWTKERWIARKYDVVSERQYKSVEGAAKAASEAERQLRATGQIQAPAYRSEVGTCKHEGTYRLWMMPRKG
jgi:hypothetical protein